MYQSGAQDTNFNMAPGVPIQLILTSTKTLFSVTAINTSNNYQLHYYGTYVGSGDPTLGITQPNSGVWGFCNMSPGSGNSTNTVFSVVSHTQQGAFMDFVGDSKTSGTECGLVRAISNSRYADIIGNALGFSTIVNAGNSDRLQEVMADWYYITNYEKPLHMNINMGRNNFSDGTTNFFYANWTNFYNVTTSYFGNLSYFPGVIVMGHIAAEQSPTTYVPYSNYIQSVTSPNVYFNPNPYGLNYTVFIGPDQIHPNVGGEALIAATWISRWGTIYGFSPLPPNNSGNIYVGTNCSYYMGQGAQGVGLYPVPYAGGSTPAAMCTFGNSLSMGNTLAMNNNSIQFDSANSVYMSA
jgi:hypothetical protein